MEADIQEMFKALYVFFFVPSFIKGKALNWISTLDSVDKTHENEAPTPGSSLGPVQFSTLNISP